MPKTGMLVASIFTGDMVFNMSAVQRKEVKKVAGDRTADYVLILYGQGESIKAIAKRLEMCEQKVRRILITENQFYTDEAKLFEDGYSIEDICKRTGKKRGTVIGRLPYIKGLYGAERPSKNAERIRNYRKKLMEN